ncbi:aldo/keto reductase [Dehalococcoidia bacterium]|nr:aldo/keto reductase [Dehalococcoidia bacterium]
MQMTPLGKTGLTVSRLGAGLARIGYELKLTDIKEAGQVLNAALDDGINFLDTAACYDISEELVGHTVAHRRDEYILATKCGHVTNGASGKPWSAQTIQDSIDRSLERMRTDHLDLVQLHSCDGDILKRGEAVEALLEAKRAGKTRFVGYSGDNEPALWAVESGIFDTLQTSFNVVDQQARIKLFGPAQSKGMGIIIKRPVANGAWGVKRSPYEYADEYFSRAQVVDGMGPVLQGPDDRMLAAMGFVLAHREVDTAIVGTRNPSHMRGNVNLVESKLPVSAEFVKELHRRFDMVGGQWAQLM